MKIEHNGEALSLLQWSRRIGVSYHTIKNRFAAGMKPPALLAPGRRREGITDTQRKVLGIIKRSIAEQGYPPTVRELGAALGVASINAVACHLRALEAKGWIRCEFNRARAITVLRDD